MNDVWVDRVNVASTTGVRASACGIPCTNCNSCTLGQCALRSAHAAGIPVHWSAPCLPLDQRHSRRDSLLDALLGCNCAVLPLTRKSAVALFRAYLIAARFPVGRGPGAVAPTADPTEIQHGLGCSRARRGSPTVLLPPARAPRADGRTAAACRPPRRPSVMADPRPSCDRNKTLLLLVPHLATDPAFAIARAHFGAFPSYRTSNAARAAPAGALTRAIAPARDAGAFGSLNGRRSDRWCAGRGRRRLPSGPLVVGRSGGDRPQGRPEAQPLARQLGEDAARAARAPQRPRSRAAAAATAAAVAGGAAGGRRGGVRGGHPRRAKRAEMRADGAGVGAVDILDIRAVCDIWDVKCCGLRLGSLHGEKDWIECAYDDVHEMATPAAAHHACWACMAALRERVRTLMRNPGNPDKLSSRLQLPEATRMASSPYHCHTNAGLAVVRTSGHMRISDSCLQPPWCNRA
eukprot:357069-Chlamydomonas_euryale.AAC.5